MEVPVPEIPADDDPGDALAVPDVVVVDLDGGARQHLVQRTIVDADGEYPRIYFQRVPEPKTAKNRGHLDVRLGGPRGTPLEENKRRVHDDVHSTRQAISQHLDVLEEAGLVTTRRDGRYKFHHVDTAPLRIIVDRWPIAGDER